MNIQMCFIKIHKVNSSKYEWPLDVLTEIFENWSFIANTTDKKVLFLNEYSNVFYQNPRSDIFKVWVAFEQCQRNWGVGPLQWLLEKYRDGGTGGQGGMLSSSKQYLLGLHSEK